MRRRALNRAIVLDRTNPRVIADKIHELGSRRADGCGCVSDPGWQPNLSWITDDLAIGGRVPLDRVAHLADPLGIRAVIDVRSEEADDPEHLLHHGVTLLHLPTIDLAALAPKALEEGVAFARQAAERGARLLVHCEHGIGRSATLALCILVDRGFDPLAALQLAKHRRPLFSPSPVQYECWVAWLKAAQGGTAHTIPDFEAFKSIAYRHLACT
jgi:Dual specificity phosphatase, catalytic domain